MDSDSQRDDTGYPSPGDGPPIWDPDRLPVEELAAEFADRFRQGEQPTIDEYVHKYPELKDEINELFPVVCTMEKVQRHLQQDSPPFRSKAPLSVEQLGDYRVIGEIARGGMGIVCEAEQVTLGRRVAVKVLPEHALRSPRDIQRFHREAQTAAKLHHSNIVPIFGVGEQDGVHYIVMQFIQGVGLDEILPEIKRHALGVVEPDVALSSSSARSVYAKRNAQTLLSEILSSDTVRPPSNGSAERPSSAATQPNGTGHSPSTDNPSQNPTEPVPHVKFRHEYWRNVARIGIQASRALHYAHAQGTLHRDIKPGNLLLDEGGVVWVADFGLAKAVGHEDVTWTGDIVGTLRYMAPERFRGEADSRSDIYSLGLTLYELLTFKRAFDGADRIAVTHNVTNEEIVPPRRLNPSIPRDLETIVLKATARDPRDRYETAEDLASDLECFLDDRPIRARRFSATEHLLRWFRRNRTVACMAATVAAVLVGACISTSLGYMRESHQRQRAEGTLQLALGALDRIYGQFAPSQVPSVTQTVESTEETTLAVQSQLPLSRDVALLLESLLDFYDKLSAQSEDGESVLLKSVMASRRVGDIQHRLGETEKARAAYEGAIAQVASVGGSFGDKDAVRIELARIHNGLGSVLRGQWKAKSAIASFQRALQLLDPVSPAPESSFERARTHYLLHLAERSRSRGRSRSGTITSSAHNLDEGISLLAKLTDEFPAIPDYRFLLARCCRAEGQRDAEQQRLRAIKLLEELVAEFPEVPDYRYELGDAYASQDFDRLWSWKQDQVDRSPQGLKLAEERLQTAFDVTQDIDVSHPNIPSYLRLKARLFHTYGTVLRDMGRPDDSLQQFHKALEKQRLAVRHSHDGHFQEVLLAHLRLDLAKLLVAIGSISEARTALEAIVSEMNALLADPASGFTRFSRRFSRDLVSESLELLSKIDSPSTTESSLELDLRTVQDKVR